MRDHSSNFSRACVAFLLAWATSLSTHADPKVYWVESPDFSFGIIRSSDVCGSNVQTLVQDGLGRPYNVALDVQNGKMYWADENTDKIQRANLDGTGIEDLVVFTELNVAPAGIALDLAAGKMYWTERGGGCSGEVGFSRIQRSDLDGMNLEDIVTGLCAPLALAIDVAGGKLYWADFVFDKIQRSNLDGTNVEDLLTLPGGAPIGIALDLTNGKLYWADAAANTVERSNLNGTDRELLISITDIGANLLGIAIDEKTPKIYVTDQGNDKIYRSSLDGSDLEVFIGSGLNNPRGITLDFSELVPGSCGDGALDVCEECDDDKTDDGDGCSSSCEIEPGFECSGQPSVCTPLCGNGTQDPGEECDDGNTEDFDGCTNECLIGGTGMPVLPSTALILFAALLVTGSWWLLRQRHAYSG